MLRVREVVDGSGSGSGRDINWTSTTGLSAFGVLEGERDFGKGMAVGSALERVGTSVSSLSDSGACSCSSSCSSPSPSGSSASSSSSSCGSPSESVPERNSSICCSPPPPSEASGSSSSSSSSSPPRGTSTNDEVDEDKLLNELAA